MLPRKYRLSTSKEIKKVLSRGKARNIKGLLFIKWLRNAFEHHRITIVVSQKVSKKAVIRNRIKRSLIGGVTTTMLENKKTPSDVTVMVRGVTVKNVKEAREELKLFLETLT